MVAECFENFLLLYEIWTTFQAAACQVSCLLETWDAWAGTEAVTAVAAVADDTSVVAVASSGIGVATLS